jgi:L,D-transpeptidase catalytic domain
MNAAQTLRNCLHRCQELGVAPTQFIFAASVATQTALLFEQSAGRARHSVRAEPFNTNGSGAQRTDAPYQVAKQYIISTSKFGIGQIAGSNKTPLGLHRIAEKIGAGCEPGTVFKGRQVVGHLRDGLPLESITTRILWLEGLEEGFNHGGNVDTHARYIYLHGFGDQASIGTPTSLGCIHFADPDLIELYDLLPGGTLVWIAAE